MKGLHILRLPLSWFYMKARPSIIACQAQACSLNIHTLKCQPAFLSPRPVFALVATPIVHTIVLCVKPHIYGHACGNSTRLSPPSPHAYVAEYEDRYTVKPPIKDTPKEDKPPNKGHTKCILAYTLCTK